MSQRFLALLFSVSIYAVSAQTLQAQTTNANNTDDNPQFYLFVSRGVVSGIEIGPKIPVAPLASWNIGGSAEWFKFKGLAVGGEFAKAIRRYESEPVTFTYPNSSGNAPPITQTSKGARGWGSLNLSYHFKGLSDSGRFVPFVTAGLSVLVRTEPVEAANYGGGVSLWRGAHRGWRLEYRKYVLRENFPAPRFRSLRFGLVLR